MIACAKSKIATFTVRHRCKHAEALARSRWAQRGGVVSSNELVLKNDRLPSGNDNFPLPPFLLPGDFAEALVHRSSGRFSSDHLSAATALSWGVR